MNLKLIEEFSFENFDILTKICICENMWGVFEMIMSFGNLIKTLLGFAKKKNYEFFENLVGLSENFYCDFQKKNLSTLKPEMQETP